MKEMHKAKGNIASKEHQNRSKTSVEKTDKEKAALKAKRKKLKEQREAEILKFREELKVLYGKVKKLEKDADAHKLYIKELSKREKKICSL